METSIQKSINNDLQNILRKETALNNQKLLT